LITFQVIDLLASRVDDAPGGRHEQDPTAIGERLHGALAALLGLRGRRGHDQGRFQEQLPRLPARGTVRAEATHRTDGARTLAWPIRMELEAGRRLSHNPDRIPVKE
jgi:hypothetical protein